MSIVIEADGVRYEATSVSEAQKILRKDRRAKAKLEAENNRRREQAQLMAKAKACDLYDRIWEQRDCPRAWIAYPVDHQRSYGAGLCKRHPTKPHTCIVYLEDKQLEVEMWGQTITHTVCNGSGFVWAIFAADTMYHDLKRFYTIQQFEGVWSLHQCNGIHLDWFNTPKSQSEE